MSFLGANTQAVVDATKPEIYDFPTWSQATPITVIHGLPNKPSFVDVVWYCKQSIGGWPAGYELNTAATGANIYGVYVGYDETAIKVVPRGTFFANANDSGNFPINNGTVSSLGLRIKVHP